MPDPVQKAERTKLKILEQALAQSSVEGLQGLTIGRLASALGVSKSGLFAHFGSKEQLEIAVLHHAAAQFRREVIEPAIRQPRGAARLVLMFELWLARLSSRRLPGGCPFLSAAFEFDDLDGPVRAELVQLETQFRLALVRAIRLSMDVGDLVCEVDPAQLGFEVHALMLAYHFESRLLRAPEARSKVERAFSALLARATGKPDEGYSALLLSFGLGSRLQP
jgi:AcrR family transcriptional regulator